MSTQTYNGTDDKPLTADEIKEMQALTFHDGYNDAMYAIETDEFGYRSRLPLVLHNEEYGNGWAAGCRDFDHCAEVHDGEGCDCG